MIEEGEMLQFKRHKKFTESSLPEPQMIKRTLLDLQFSAAGEIRLLRHFRRVHKDPSRVVARFEEYVTQLFLLLSCYPCVQAAPNFQMFNDAIESGSQLKFAVVFKMFHTLKNLMYEPLGISKIEFKKMVGPEDAWEEGSILGEGS